MPVIELPEAASSEQKDADPRTTIRAPRAEDGAQVLKLIKRCPPLDQNSAYCYLLQCSQFADTSAIAEMDGTTVGFISGHRLPNDPDALFIWQVAVAEEARGQGLGRKMMLDILRRPTSVGFTHLLATATDDNTSSKGMFQSLARVLETDMGQSLLFDQDIHFAGAHESEILLTIGPFSAQINEGQTSS